MNNSKKLTRKQSNPVSNNKANLQKELLARYMILAGFITYIVMIETSLTAKKVRLIRNSLIEEGFPEERRSRAARSSKTLLKNRKAKISASIAMALYYRFGKEKVLETIDIQALTRAYSMYVSITKDAPFDKNMDFHEPVFDISDIWSFAQELRSGEAVIFNCKTCNCDYYSAYEEPTLIDCPFCDSSI